MVPAILHLHEGQMRKRLGTDMAGVDIPHATRYIHVSNASDKEAKGRDLVRIAAFRFLGLLRSILRRPLNNLFQIADSIPDLSP
jgi:hypothetical protein